jgi:hypothetical protein
MSPPEPFRISSLIVECKEPYAKSAKHSRLNSSILQHRAGLLLAQPVCGLIH